MDRIFFKEVRLTNFKCFKNKIIEIPSRMTILGGKNGLGKTTVFDAVELILTGKINRLVDYNEFINKRYSLNEKKKPLVFDTSLPEVKVELLIEYGGRQLWLMRCAPTESIKNPIKFDCFNILYSKPNTESEYHEMPIDENPLSGSLMEFYDFLHYINQEESAVYLKKSFTDRNLSLKKLFNIDGFEHDRKKIKDLQKSVKKVENQFNSEADSLRAQISRVVKSSNTFSGRGVEYVRLFKDTRDWDKENPVLSVENVEVLLGDDGLLATLLYCQRHYKEFRKYGLNNLLKPYIEDAALLHLSKYIFYVDDKDVELFRIWKTVLKDRYQSFNIEEIKSDILPNLLKDWIPNTAIDGLEALRKSLITLHDGISSIDKLLTSLVSEREKIVIHLSDVSLSEISDCPLCGQSYADHQSLMNAIINHEEKIRRLLADNSSKLNEGFRQLQNYFRENVVNFIETKLRDRGIDENVYSIVKDTQLASFVKRVRDKYQIDLHKESTLKTTTDAIRAKLLSYIVPTRTDIDYKRISQFMAVEGKNIIPDSFNEEAIVKKRDFLAQIWRTQSSKVITELNAKLAMILKKHNKSKDLLNHLKKIETSINAQEQEYISHLITNIEILFFVYTGRIMQDCLYGRGLFLKRIGNENMVIFVSGDYDNEVDALYSLSSGQISALVIALTLSLHKLYADVAFLAIDDPVQTMDDMNLWGLTETLRNEFSDSSILLSTHERKYGGLLRYKLDKAGIDATYLSMQDLINE